MKLFYDFHIHTGLSPCGSLDMTPNNIINMALIKELDAIAITDHNSCGNVSVILELAKQTDLIVIPGMELETAEEVHTVCLFPDFDSAKHFDEIVAEKLTKIKNDEKIFGEQVFFDCEDNPIGCYENLLLTATSLDLESVVKLVKEHNGILIPAHVDRSSYSIISNLGFIPYDLDINLIEISKKADPVLYIEKNKKLLMGKSSYITSSDAHYLEDMNERINFLEFEKKPSAKEIIEKLLRIC